MTRPNRNIPKLKKYRSARDFFRDFYQSNQPGLSHRGFASEIGWPISLLGDMIQGRKPLTVNRAVEFARYLDFNGVQCEYLVMLALKEVDNAGVQDYAQTYFETEGAVLNSDPLVEAQTHTMRGDVYADIEYMVLHAFLTWSKGAVDLDLLHSYLPAFPKLQDRKFVLSLLTRMKEDGVIEGAPPKINILKKNLFSEDVRSAQASYLASFARVCELTPEKVKWSAGSVIFPKKRIAELNDRREALTYWILMTANREEPDESTDPADHTVLQIDLSVFDILGDPGTHS